MKSLGSLHNTYYALHPASILQNESLDFFASLSIEATHQGAHRRCLMSSMQSTPSVKSKTWASSSRSASSFILWVASASDPHPNMAFTLWLSVARRSYSRVVEPTPPERLAIADAIITIALKHLCFGELMLSKCADSIRRSLHPDSSSDSKLY